MKLGRNMEVRPLGGGLGCLAMLLISVFAAVTLTVFLTLSLTTECLRPGGSAWK
jgi:hypothetical protein